MLTTAHGVRRMVFLGCLAALLGCEVRQTTQAPVQPERVASPEVERKLAELRAIIARDNLTFEVGYTTAMDVPLALLAGTLPPSLTEFKAEARKVNALAVKLEKIDRAAAAAFSDLHPGVIPVEPTCSSSLSSFDWRQSGKVGAVRDQRNCGSCWDFAAMSAFETSYAIRNTDLLDTSEQQIMECAGAGSCCGGNYSNVFPFLLSPGVGDETAYLYQPCSNCCPSDPPLATPYRAAAWGYVDGATQIPSTAEIKQAICDHGAIAVSVNATPLFQGYTGGVFNEHTGGTNLNHAVTLIGWDDAKKAWLMRNSWGPWWGETGGFGTERGYMWIAYDSNGIGSFAAWVDARSKFYVLPRDYEALIPVWVYPIPGPLERPVR